MRVLAIVIALGLFACTEDESRVPVPIERCDPRATCRSEQDLGLEAAWPRYTIYHGLLGADGVNVSDINDDGFLDVVSGWEQSSRVTVSLHPGCACAARDRWPTVELPERLGSVEDAIFADVDHDGHADVIAGGEGGQLFVYFAPTDPELLLSPWAWTVVEVLAARDMQRWIQIAHADLDGDGRKDLIAGGRVGASVGYFTSSTPRDGASYLWHELGVVGCIYSLIPHDADQDGDLDLVISDHDPLTPPARELLGARWLENPGIADAQWLNHPIRIVGGDLGLARFIDVRDHDIIVGSASATVNVTASVSTADWLEWTVDEIPQPPNVGWYEDTERGDVDGDGLEDVVFSYSHASGDLSGVVWLHADGAGGWQRGEISGPAGTKYDNLVLADVDGDGDLDVITSEQASNSAPADEQLGVVWYANPKRSP